MQTTAIRQQLQEYVDSGDDKLLKLMLALAREYNDEELEYEFTDEEIRLFDERRAKRLRGESKIHSWEDAKSIITGKKSL